MIEYLAKSTRAQLIAAVKILEGASFEFDRPLNEVEIEVIYDTAADVARLVKRALYKKRIGTLDRCLRDACDRLTADISNAPKSPSLSFLDSVVYRAGYFARELLSRPERGF